MAKLLVFCCCDRLFSPSHLTSFTKHACPLSFSLSLFSHHAAGRNDLPRWSFLKRNRSIGQFVWRKNLVTSFRTLINVVLFYLEKWLYFNHACRFACMSYSLRKIGHILAAKNVTYGLRQLMIVGILLAYSSFLLESPWMGDKLIFFCCLKLMDFVAFVTFV